MRNNNHKNNYHNDYHYDPEDPEEVHEDLGEEGFEESSPEDCETLRKKNEQLQKQADDYLDSLQRERASFANFKRRIEQDNAEAYERALGDATKFFLPVVDDLERALRNKPTDSADKSWMDGIDLILQKLLKTMENRGITPLPVQPGDTFDPIDQEAVTHEEHDGFTDGQVIEVVQTGYKHKDRIIRPAMVRVAK
jgi:molecular chaperone GrpE